MHHLASMIKLKLNYLFKILALVMAQFVLNSKQIWLFVIDDYLQCGRYFNSLSKMQHM